MWKWATVIGLSMTPALVLGQSAACAAGIGFHFDPYALVSVVAVAGFAEGLLIVWLAILGKKVGRIQRFITRLHTPRATRWAERWGTYGGLALGPALLGQEPIIIALVWMDVPTRRLALPLALSNLVYAVLYYAIVRAGWDSIASFT